MKLWGGRFSQGLQDDAAEYNNSIVFDWRLVDSDIRGSLAWAKALAQAGALTADETSQICAGLEQVQAEVNSGEFHYAPSDEDVHTAVERRLTELVGPVGGKLHTGRSRNDQVATDFRLWLMAEIDVLAQLLENVQAALVERAESDLGILMPGYTHLQRAQPILMSHWWLSHFWPLLRDRERLAQLRVRAAVLPLGSGALAGAPFAVDRRWLAQELGFADISANSLDAVSDRDFAAEFLFISALVGVHLSRISEMLILFSTAEFGFVEISDDYSTGSSLMPQKKNPDTLELTRGKAGTLIGRLTGLLATLKGLPSAYDKDLQEDKIPVFEAADTLSLMLRVMAGLLRKLSVRPEAMRRALDPALLATDLADYLVDRGVPFREAHRIVGQIVRLAQSLGTGIDRLPLADLQSISPVFSPDVADVFDFEASANRRSLPGGTGLGAVKDQLEQAKAKIVHQS
jgi:argininosuccinate lyase